MATTYPAIYTTSSSVNPDLDGQMIMSDPDTVSSYTSSTLNGVAATNLRNQGGRGLHFSLEFTNGTVTTRYQINAHKTNQGQDYKGWSGQQAPKHLEAADDWTATDNGPLPTN
jgi:hypothetical protein